MARWRGKIRAFEKAPVRRMRIACVLFSLPSSLLRAIDQCREDCLLRELQRLRTNAIELYSAENGGALPGADGNEATFKNDLDPYLRGNAVFPKCQVGAKNDQVKMTAGLGTLAGEAAPLDAWNRDA